MDSNRFRQVIERIDQLNRDDPTQELVEGVSVPRELLYSQRLTQWVLRLDPAASEVLQLAARGQHLRRWTIPRDRYERTRRGYLRWRETLKAFHAEAVSAVCRDAGYPEEFIERVRLLILKKHLGADPETQTLEDALCLVFLEHQFTELSAKTPPEKMRDVLQKTWRKMSERARREAMQLPLGDAATALLREAISKTSNP